MEDGIKENKKYEKTPSILALETYCDEIHYLIKNYQSFYNLYLFKYIQTNWGQTNRSIFFKYAFKW